MCGITGIYNFKAQSQVNNQEILKKMTDTIKHRGPDDEGYFAQKNLFLGHRRLSIVDLSRHGHQPMSYDRGNLTIVFNGEIYNHPEIRAELESQGYRFKSATDTEVILAAYEEWGRAAVAKFNGMWAFVIYDRQKKILFGSRDRLGVKPFYYFLDKEKFVFASEIKALLAHPGIKARANDFMVWQFLLHSRSDHNEETFFEGVRELRGGYNFVFNLRNKKFTKEQYWDLKQSPKIRLATDEAYAQEFRRLFLDSVKLRLRSDVAVGTCLSGGLDSSAIVCAVNQFLKAEKIAQVGEKQQTFSACYDKRKYPGCDERQYIRAVIRKTKVKPHYVFPQGEELVNEVKKVIWHQDVPFYSTSIYAQWNVFRLASEAKVKVMLDGQGSDEFLAGYQQFFSLYFLELIRELRFARIARELLAYNRHHRQTLLNLFGNLAYVFSTSGKGNFLMKIYRNHLAEYHLLKKKWRNQYDYSMVLAPGKNIFKNSLYTQAVKSSLPTLLRFEDRNSMAFSIESRVPFLDYRLAEFIYGLPDNQKIAEGQTKWVMRQALKGILPEKIRSRQDKIGFATPEDIWLKENFLEEFKKVFTSERFLARGYVERRQAAAIVDKFLSGKIKNFSFFWRLYCLEIWFRLFIDKEK